MKIIETISQSQWDNLASKKIYFGHQSVGYNIIDGVELILKENPEIGINIKEGVNIKGFNKPVFRHARNGENGDPKSKIDAFYQIIDEGLGDNVDIAGFKFCYVDFNKNTDVIDVFKHYKMKMDKLSKKYPRIEIVHYTVPLRSIQQGPRAWVKKILNKSIGIDDNVARQKFNDLLILEYNDKPIFDIAKYESTYLNEDRKFTIVDKKKVYSMIPEYTNDGGHLSDTGKYYIGSKFLVFLSQHLVD